MMASMAHSFASACVWLVVFACDGRESDEAGAVVETVFSLGFRGGPWFFARTPHRFAGRTAWLAFMPFGKNFGEKPAREPQRDHAEIWA